MNKVLSVVIPAYNVEQYLEKTLRSCVVDDEESRKLYEVIVVNDGSTDKTREIAERFVEKYFDTQTFKVVNKENGGYGSTINEGLAVATGKYFKILDGDDWYDTIALSKLVLKLKEVEMDVVITDYTRVRDNTGEKEFCRYELENEKELCMNECRIPPQLLEMYGLCYKTELLRKHSIRITEHCFYTDTEYVLYPMPFIATAIYYPIDLYQYRIGREGQSVSLEGITKHLGDLELVIDNLNSYFEHRVTDINVEMIERRIAKTYNYYINYLLLLPSCSENKHKLKKFIKNIKKNYPERYSYCKNRKISLLEISNYILYRPCCVWHRKMEWK